jgi:hypothetical protein
LAPPVGDSVSPSREFLQEPSLHPIRIAAAEMGWIDRERIIMESLLSIRRAGADIILAYFAKDVARNLQKCS